MESFRSVNKIVPDFGPTFLSCLVTDACFGLLDLFLHR